jgi:hypothetical protein
MRNVRFRRLGVVLLALVLAGCWQQAGGGPENTRFNAIESDLTRDNVTSLAERWRTPVDGFVTEPIMSGDRIYAATRKNQADTQFIAELMGRRS